MVQFVQDQAYLGAHMNWPTGFLSARRAAKLRETMVRYIMCFAKYWVPAIGDPKRPWFRHWAHFGFWVSWPQPPHVAPHVAPCGGKTRKGDGGGKWIDYRQIVTISAIFINCH